MLRICVLKIIFALALLHGNCPTYGQENHSDSLETQLLQHPTRDTLRLKILITLANQYLSTSEKSKAYCQEAMALAQELKDDERLAEASNSLTHYYWYRSDLAQALEQALTTLRIYEKLAHPMGLFEANLTLAGVYMSLREFEQADAYMNKVLDWAENNEDRVDMGALYDKVAFLKLQENKVREGISYLKKSLAIMEQRGDLYGQASCYFLLAKAELKSDNIPGTVPHYKNAIRLARLSGHANALSTILACHEGLGESYVMLKNFDRGELHLDSALQIAKNVNSVNMIISVYQDRVQLYEAKGDFKTALRYERIHEQMEDSVYEGEKSQQLAEAQVRYETEKKEQTILLLDQERKSKSVLNRILFAGIATLAILAVLVYLLGRSRTRKARQLLEMEKTLNSKLVEVDKLKSQFFANISHEFRTPLTLILSPVEEKLSVGGLAQKDLVSFQSIRRSAKRLLDLINQLLDLSKLESGFMKMRFEAGDLNRFLAPLLSAFDSLAEVSHVTYQRKMDIPQTIVLFDSDKLEKIVNNLLSNAFKFSPHGAEVSIRITGTQTERDVVLNIDVRNTGIAIAPQELNTIFDPFVQAESSHVSKGTGLGLSLVRELVKLHRGEVSVTSDANAGTTFTTLLRFEKSMVEDTMPSPKMDVDTSVPIIEEDTTETDEAKETILIVEDDPDLRSFIRSGLQDEYNVVEASNGTEGLRLARELSINLVISDVMMPGTDGIQLCRQLKMEEMTSHIPIVLLTARADHETKLEGLRTGADDYLMKPFNMQELVARVSNLITQRKRLIQKYHQQVTIQPEEITVTSLDERFMQRAMQVVESNLEESSFTVDLMAKELGMSRTNLHRKLKSIIGQSASEFIQDYRLRRAAVLIEKKADNLAQIAYQVGFNDHSYFTKCFKKKFGKTPTEFAQGKS